MIETISPLLEQAAIPSSMGVLEKAMVKACEVYSNVHRGEGHLSAASTELYERSRVEILNSLGLNIKNHTVIYGSPRRAKLLTTQLNEADYQIVSSDDLGLPFGIRAIAVRKSALPKGRPFDTGGGTIKLVSPKTTVWADVPNRFEAGTPPIIPAILLAVAQRLRKEQGADFTKDREPNLAPEEVLYGHDDLSDLSGMELLTALREKFIGKSVMVPTIDGEMGYVNADNGASTPTLQPVLEAMLSSLKLSGDERVRMVEEVRQICLDYLGASMDRYDMVFVSNTTEALNIAATAVAKNVRNDEKLVTLATQLEHHSNELVWRGKGSHFTIPIDSEGFIDLGQLEKKLKEYNQECKHGEKRIRVFAISGASNVLGSMNDLEKISKIVHRYGVLLVVDAAQLLAHRKIEMEKTGIDVLAFSAHKAYSPAGSGGLVFRKGFLDAFSESEREMIVRSGEENVVGITALGKSLYLLGRIGLDVIEAEERKLVYYFLQKLSEIAEIEVYGVRNIESARSDSRGPIITVSSNRVPYNVVARELSTHGVGARAGCFCAHPLVQKLAKKEGLPAYIASFGMWVMPVFTNRILPGLVRFSFGLENTEADVDRIVDVLSKIHKAERGLRGLLDRLPARTRNATPFPEESSITGQMNQFVHTVVESIYPTL